MEVEEYKPVVAEAADFAEALDKPGTRHPESCTVVQEGEHYKLYEAAAAVAVVAAANREAASAALSHSAPLNHLSLLSPRGLKRCLLGLSLCRH